MSTPLRATLAAALLVLLAAPAASAALPLRASLVLEGAPALDGRVAVRSAHAILDLGPAAAARALPPIAWDAARGYEVVREHSGIGGPLGPGAYVSVHADNATRAYGPATLDGASCPDACMLLLFPLDERSSVGLDGNATGALERIASARTYWVGNPTAGQDRVHLEAPAGALAVAAGRAGGEGLPLRDARVLAEGRVGVVLWGVHAALAHDGARHRVETGTTHHEGEGPAGWGVRNTTRFLVLEATGLRVAPGPDLAASLVAPSPTLDVDGELRAPSATGRLWLGRDAHALDHDALAIAGVLRVEARDGGRSGPLALDEAREPVEMAGQAERVVVGGRALGDAPAPARATATLGLAALLAALVWLYSRIAPSRVLENPNRAAILDLVAATPGIDITRVRAAMGVTRVVALHHLRVLESHRLVASQRIGRSRGFFLVGARDAMDAAPASAALLDRTRARVLDAVRGAPLTQEEIAAATGVGRRLVAYHLGRLASVGLVEAHGARPRRYAATPRGRG